MKKNKTFNLISCLALTVLLAAWSGCASHNYQQGAKTGAGLAEASNKIGEGKVKIDASLGALNDLINNPQGDLTPKFNHFNDTVADLDSAAANLDAKVKDMRESGKKYFENWDQQLATIKNEDIKNRSAERKAEVQKKFTDIKRSYTSAEMAFKPFMSDLHDIQTALGTDLTAGGVSAVKGAADKASQDSLTLKTSMDQLAADFKDLGVAMSASSAAPQPAPAAQ